METGIVFYYCCNTEGLSEEEGQVAADAKQRMLSHLESESKIKTGKPVE